MTDGSDHETELKTDVRQQTDTTDTATLSEDALDTAYRNAKRHIRVRKSLPRESEFEWFDPEEPAREEALYWWTCLFVKVQTGELDAQEVQIGAVEAKALLAKDDNDVTQWYRNARTAMRSLNPGYAFTMSSPTRDDRVYGADDEGAAGGLTDDL